MATAYTYEDPAWTNARNVLKAARLLEISWFNRPGEWTEEEKALSKALEPLWRQIDEVLDGI